MTKPRRTLESRGRSTSYVTTGGAGYVPSVSTQFVNNTVRKGNKALNIGKSATIALGSYIKDKVTGKPDAERNAGLIYFKNLNKENQRTALDVIMHSTRGAEVMTGEDMINIGIPNYIKRLAGKPMDINYTGNADIMSGDVNTKRDLVNLYLKGNTTGFEDVTDNEYYHHGPDYKRYFEKYYPGFRPKTYKMSSDGIPLELTKEEIDYANSNLNKTIPVDIGWTEGGDNVGNANRWYKNIDGKLYAIDSDVWDFNPKDWSWQGDDNKIVDKAGIPFILKAIRPVKLKEYEKRYGGSIHIAPSKKGTFTAAATKHGMGVQEFAARVLRNKEDYSPSLVKKANFARNASKWH